MLQIREKLQDFYNEYDFYIRPLLKFAVAVFLFIGINNMLGYMEMLNQLFIVVILAVIVSLLPWNGLIVVSLVMIVLHCFALGLEVGALATALYLIMSLFYFRFVPEDAPALVLTPLAFRFGFPAAVPIGLGMFRNVSSAFTMIFAVVSWNFLRIVSTVIEPMKAAGEASMLDVLKEALQQLLGNTDMYVTMIACVAVCLFVSVIRTIVTVYSGVIASFIGVIVYSVIMLLGQIFLGVDADMLMILINACVSLAIAFVIVFFGFQVDYSGSERLQFEDDHYVYYVKVIPKRKNRRAAQEQKEISTTYPEQKSMPVQPRHTQNIPDVVLKQGRTAAMPGNTTVMPEAKKAPKRKRSDGVLHAQTVEIPVQELLGEMKERQVQDRTQVMPDINKKQQ